MYASAPEAFVGPVFEAFEQATGIDIAVRYGGSEALVALILEEGDLSPADAFFTLDAGALATLSSRGLFRQLPASILDRVEARFRSPEGLWVGVTGRARVLLYSTENVTAGELPTSVFDLTDPRWRGRVGWSATNGAFQPFVTAMLITVGEERTRAWLEGMIANGVRDFPNNISQVHAVGRGEIDLVLVNHYYLYRPWRSMEGSSPLATTSPQRGHRGVRQRRRGRHPRVEQPAGCSPGHDRIPAQATESAALHRHGVRLPSRP